MKPELSKSVLVTGAAGSLGAVVLPVLKSNGYYVIATGRSQKGPEHCDRYYSLDMTEHAAVADLFTDLQSVINGGISGIFLAGGFNAGALKDLTTDQMEQQVQLNFYTAMVPALALLNYNLERKQEGRLLFAGTAPGLHPEQAAGAAAYGLSKSLLFHFARMVNSKYNGDSIYATVMVLRTLDTAINRKAMPDTRPAEMLATGIVAEAIVKSLKSEHPDPLIQF